MGYSFNNQPSIIARIPSTKKGEEEEAEVEVGL
jgi:hypothetical protein